MFQLLHIYWNRKDIIEKEVKAIEIALTSIVPCFNKFQKAVFLVDTKSAIKAIENYDKPSTTYIQKYRNILRFLREQMGTIIFQWIPSQIGLKENDQANGLTKKGTYV